MRRSEVNDTPDPATRSIRLERTVDAPRTTYSGS